VSNNLLEKHLSTIKASGANLIRVRTPSDPGRQRDIKNENRIYRMKFLMKEF